MSRNSITISSCMICLVSALSCSVRAWRAAPKLSSLLLYPNWKRVSLFSSQLVKRPHKSLIRETLCTRFCAHINCKTYTHQTNHRKSISKLYSGKTNKQDTSITWRPHWTMHYEPRIQTTRKIRTPQEHLGSLAVVITSGRRMHSYLEK